ncbi:MAG: DUF3301 domain-containing protein [Pseudomonadota bacterium]
MEGVILGAMVVTVVFFWLDGARAREIATALAREACRGYGLQFLDGTASLVRLGLGRSARGLRLRRLYKFDYSEVGVGRHTGHLMLLGLELEDFSLGLPGDGHDQDTDRLEGPR